MAAPPVTHPAKNAIVYVVADEKSVDAATDGAATRRSRRYVFGAGIMPTALLGGILERARIREVRPPRRELCTGTALHPVDRRCASSCGAAI